MTMPLPFRCIRVLRAAVCTQTSGLLAFFVLLCALETPLFAQPRPDLLQTDSSSNDKLTKEELGKRQKSGAESADLSDDDKAKLDNHYQAAIENLNKVEELSKQSAAYKADADNVQDRVQQLQVRLNELQATKPSLPPLETLAELDQERSKLALKLTDLKTKQADAEAEPSTRANRRKEIRGLLLSATQRLEEIDKQLATAPPNGEPQLLTRSRLDELSALKLLIQTELPALQNELAKYDAEDVADYVRLLRDVRTQEVAFAEAELVLLDNLIKTKRAQAVAEALRKANLEKIAAQEELQELTSENELLAKQAVDRLGPIDTAKTRLANAKLQLERLKKQYESLEKKVETIGLTGAIGNLLRRHRNELPSLSELRQSINDRKKTIEQTQYDLFEHDDKRAALANREPLVKAVLAKATSKMTKAERDDLETATRDVLDNKAEYLDRLIRNDNLYLDTLYELDLTEQLLVAQTEKFSTFINERVLWIRSNEPLLAFWKFDSSDKWLLDPTEWQAAGNALWLDAQQYAWLHAFAIAIFVALVSLRKRFIEELIQDGKKASKARCTQFSPTLRATGFTFLIALPWPAVVAFVAIRLNSQGASNESADGVLAIARGFAGIAWVLLPIELLRTICRRAGLADHHFDWPDSTIQLFRQTLPRLLAWSLPLVFVILALDIKGEEYGRDLIERTCFVTAAIVLALFLRKVLRPDTGILRDYLKAHENGWIARIRPIWYWGSVLTPITLAMLTIIGFYYTAQQLAWRFFTTILLVLALQLFRALVERFIIVQQREVELEQARERREAERKKQRAANDGESLVPEGEGLESLISVDEFKADVKADTAQSRRLLGATVVAASVVGVWMLWIDVLPALRILDRWPLWTTKVEVAATKISDPVALMSGIPNPTTKSAADPITQTTMTVVRDVTPRDVGLAILVLVLTIILVRNIPGLMELWILRRLPMDQSVRYAITTLTSYCIALLGIILAFHSISIGWSKVQWLATALTFGLAFGLQEIFANFVAGLILLFEQPIRIGDVVTVDDVSGVVSRIRIRATTITNWDRKEYVIPNREFITGRMLNWTLSDKVNRIVIEVGIAYGSDVEKAKQLLLDVCNAHPLILDEPSTSVTFQGFGNSTLDFCVRTYLPNLDNRLSVIDKLHTDIDQAFRAADIEIAFPQQDIHVRSIPGGLPAA